jgi:hypothetical protein
LYGLGEQNGVITDQSQKIINLSSNPKELSDFMDANQYHYIYIGAKGGILSPQKLLNSNFFTLIYYRDGVWIFNRKP